MKYKISNYCILGKIDLLFKQLYVVEDIYNLSFSVQYCLKYDLARNIILLTFTFYAFWQICNDEHIS